MSVITRTLGILLGLLLFTAALGGVPTQHGGAQAEAATVHTSAQQRLHAMKVALAQRGDPYRYGAPAPAPSTARPHPVLLPSRGAQHPPNHRPAEGRAARDLQVGQAQGRHHPVRQRRQRLPRGRVHRERPHRARQPLGHAGEGGPDLDLVLRGAPALTRCGLPGPVPVRGARGTE